MLFEPLQINTIRFDNRVVRSSIGGRLAYYDGTVSPAYVHFDKRFANNGLGGLISPTISINEKRMSPQEYPCLHDDRFITPLEAAVKAIKKGNSCKYIVQLGDTGAHSHTSLVPQEQDRISSSVFFDPLYGYVNSSVAMTKAQIQDVVSDFVKAACRVQKAGCDGVEITASKGYIIQQFLNPGINRRTDEYGGSPENRFRLLKEVVEGVRQKVGKNFLFGIRLSSRDFNYLPLNVRIPWPPFAWPPKDFFFGNDLPQMIRYAQQLEKLGVDYLHVTAGFGFPNPKESPGDFPERGLHNFVNATRYLGGKAKVRAIIYNAVPRFLRNAIIGYGWRQKEAANADDAGEIKKAVTIPVIANGGFQRRSVIEGALQAKKCDMVSIARPLLANPDLIAEFEKNPKMEKPEKPCSFCSLCCSQTAFFPIGCWDESRFDSPDHMINQIYALCSPNAPFNLRGDPDKKHPHGQPAVQLCD